MALWHVWVFDKILLLVYVQMLTAITMYSTLGHVLWRYVEIYIAYALGRLY